MRQITLFNPEIPSRKAAKDQTFLTHLLQNKHVISNFLIVSK